MQCARHPSSPGIVLQSCLLVGTAVEKDTPRSRERMFQLSPKFQGFVLAERGLGGSGTRTPGTRSKPDEVHGPYQDAGEKGVVGDG